MPRVIALPAAAVPQAKTAAGIFIRDGLFRLGPTFVKLGQVISTRTDILDKEYIEVLRDLQVCTHHTPAPKLPGTGYHPTPADLTKP